MANENMTQSWYLHLLTIRNNSLIKQIVCLVVVEIRFATMQLEDVREEEEWDMNSNEEGDKPDEEERGPIHNKV